VLFALIHAISDRMLFGVEMPCEGYTLKCMPLYGEKKGKAIPVTGHEGREGCEMSRLPHFF
jgi:hypothetical protein